MVKNPPTVQESWVHSLDREDPLEEVTANHYSILAGKVQWIGEPGGLQSIGWRSVGDN